MAIPEEDPSVRANSDSLFPDWFPMGDRAQAEAVQPHTVPLADWQQMIERKLFGLTGEHPGVSERTLLSFLIRRVGDHGFNEAIRSFARQPEAQATPNLAYLLGLDSALAARYQEIAARRAVRDQLKKAVDDPVWGKVVGKASDLRGEIAVQQSKMSELQRQIDSFRVVPQYEELKDRADELARRIQELHTEDAIDRRNLDHLERAITETVDPEVRYLEPVYRELGIVLPDQALQRFDDVRKFHAAVVRNQRIYLEEEIENTRAALDRRKTERARLGEEQSFILRELSEGGALEALTTLQKALAQEEAKLGALEHRLAAAQTVESSSREIEFNRIDLEREVARDLDARQTIVSEASQLFNKLVVELYGRDRSAYLAIEAGRSSLKITPKIVGDRSQGINKMLIFCFDFTLAVLAHRSGRAPDFLVHDSHIFDGVDDRQLTRALEIAVEYTQRENLQYIVTINEDDLGKARALGFAADKYTIDPVLTDAFADGGLFGFRFER